MFQDVYTAESLQTPWYVICGNHDHYGNCSAEIAYTNVSRRWTFPDYYYSKVCTDYYCTIQGICRVQIITTLALWYTTLEYLQVFDIPGSDKKLAVVFIDTVQLAGLTHPTLRSLPPAGPVSHVTAESQWDWINQTLSQYANPSANVQWTIVVGHYPGMYAYCLCVSI